MRACAQRYREIDENREISDAKKDNILLLIRIDPRDLIPPKRGIRFIFRNIRRAVSETMIFLI